MRSVATYQSSAVRPLYGAGPTARAAVHVSTSRAPCGYVPPPAALASEYTLIPAEGREVNLVCARVGDAKGMCNNGSFNL